MYLCLLNNRCLWLPIPLAAANRVLQRLLCEERQASLEWPLQRVTDLYYMLEFRPVELVDRPLIEAYVHPLRSRQLNYTFEVLFLWRDACEFEICEYKGMLLIKTFYFCNHNFLFPVGEDRLEEAMELMMEYAKRYKCPFSMLKVNQQQKEILERRFPDRFNYREDRNDEEYLYLSERLMTLQGKALQPKRNHINALIKEHTWKFEPITKENFDHLQAFNRRWQQGYDNELLPPSMKIENQAVESVLEHYFSLAPNGGILWVDGEVAGYSIGCPTASDTYLTLFERADPAVRGAYQLLNREFTRAYASTFTYVNRAEDCGDEGLRKAKMSYHPDRLDKRYVISLRP